MKKFIKKNKLNKKIDLLEDLKICIGFPDWTKKKKKKATINPINKKIINAFNTL